MNDNEQKENVFEVIIKAAYAMRIKKEMNEQGMSEKLSQVLKLVREDDE